MNFFVMLFAPFMANFLSYYLFSYESPLAHQVYNIPERDALRESTSVSSVNDLVYVAVTLIFGPIYDMYGRKKPAIFFYICLACGWALLPIGWGSSS